LAQQAAEKALKAVLVYVQVDFPWVHDLDALRNLIPEGWTVRHGHADLAALSEWAVEARYPSRHAQDPTPDDARGAVEEAREVYESARNDLGIRGVPVPSGPGLPEPGV
jgi:HEPN domain-containing protein